MDWSGPSMSTSHFVMFCSSKMIFMPVGVSAMHSPYSYVMVNRDLESRLVLVIRPTFMMRFFAPVLIVAICVLSWCVEKLSIRSCPSLRCAARSQSWSPEEEVAVGMRRAAGLKSI